MKNWSSVNIWQWLASYDGRKSTRCTRFNKAKSQHTHKNVFPTFPSRDSNITNFSVQKNNNNNNNNNKAQTTEGKGRNHRDDEEEQNMIKMNGEEIIVWLFPSFKVAATFSLSLSLSLSFFFLSFFISLILLMFDYFYPAFQRSRRRRRKLKTIRWPKNSIESWPSYIFPTRLVPLPNCRQRMDWIH